VNPLVSVCIPTYNNPDGLLRVLKLITSQTYNNIEIIVSVNPSANEDVNIQNHNILDGIADLDPRIRKYYQVENIEVDNNYRFVIDKAEGTYFMFAQDDDWWSPGFIEKLVSALEAKPSSPVAICPSRYVNECGVQSVLHKMQNLSLLSVTGNGDMGLVTMGVWRREAFRVSEVRLHRTVLGGDHITTAHAMMIFGDVAVVDSERYTKGYTKGRFSVCFTNDFWYSFRSWYHLIRTLAKSQYVPAHRKLILPVVAATNFVRSCAITTIQMIVMLPDTNPVKQLVQRRFFGAN
jgi:glycosyltransferase involved in cell wall biosynthesis